MSIRVIEKHRTKTGFLRAKQLLEGAASFGGWGLVRLDKAQGLVRTPHMHFDVKQPESDLSETRFEISMDLEDAKRVVQELNRMILAIEKRILENDA